MIRRIHGIEYRIVFTRQRQILDGREYLALVDPDRREIRIAAPLRRVVAEAVGQARRMTPPAPRAQRPQRRQRRSVPVTISGCYTWGAIPWPWWEG